MLIVATPPRDTSRTTRVVPTPVHCLEVVQLVLTASFTTASRHDNCACLSYIEILNAFGAHCELVFDMSSYTQTPADVIFTISNVEDRLTHIFERVFDLIEVIDKRLKVSAHTSFF
jgi:hypothetical protein